jgi:hypothetical protein
MVRSATDSVPAFLGVSNTITGDGVGVRGDARSPDATGVLGNSTAGTGVKGTSHANIGVSGISSTSIGVFGQSTSDAGVAGQSTSSAGVVGQSESSNGVVASSTSGPGLWAATQAVDWPAALCQSFGNRTGVLGSSGATHPSTLAKTGVYGYAAQDATAVGVRGESTTGIGVHATSRGTALQVSGKAQFSRSGRASLPAGKTFVDVTVPGGLAPHSVVHATLQSYRSGTAVAAARCNYPSAGKARIYLTKVASRSAATSVGWFVAEY